MDSFYRPLDRERQSAYKFLVLAADGSSYDAKRTFIPVEISVGDVNDNAPVFEEYPFKSVVPIDIQPGQNIIKVKATDADIGLNGEIIYTFLREEEKPKFRIHPSTGVVTATSSLAQDYGKIYHLDVMARDKGNPPKICKGLVEVQIGDIDESTTVLKFQNETYRVIVQENSAIGTEIVRVTALRSDGRRDRISYSIGSGNDDSTFSIDEDTGLVRINDPEKLDAELLTNLHGNDEVVADIGSNVNSWQISLDGQQSREEPRESSQHVLTLAARTSGPERLEAYAKLVVRVSDVNDNPPIFTQNQYSATVLEGNAKGNFVVQASSSTCFFFFGISSRQHFHECQKIQRT